MEDVDDDFGELYADVEVQASSAVNGGPVVSQLYTQPQQLSNKVSNESSDSMGGDGRRENDSGRLEVDSGSESDSEDDDDDFDVVVNDDDVGVNNGGSDGREARTVREDEENVFVAMTWDGSSMSKNQDRVDRGGMEQSGNGHSQYKFAKQHESVSIGNQRVISLSRGDRENIGHIQNRRTSIGRVGPSYAGTFHGLSEHGSGFWLPWHRTILDVDIDMFEQKPWTLPGADTTDYFNFGLDEESWKSYCQSLDLLRQQSFLRSWYQVRLRSKLENGAKTIEETENGDVNGKPIHNEDRMRKQIGQAIHVEDSYIERQPSMDTRLPRIRDSDVVIEIIVQDPKDSNLDKEEPDKIFEAKHAILEDGCGIDNVEPKTEEDTHYKSHDMAKDSVEGNIKSPNASSELKRSFESATGSNLMIQDSSRQDKGHRPNSDALRLGKVDTFSKGYSRAVEKLNISTEDADMNSAETNPCVAGIDVSFDDQLQSNPTPSDSVTWSKASEDTGHCELRKIQDSRRSSADSVLEGHQAEEDDRHVSRKNGREGIRMKVSAVKCHSRVRSPAKEDWKLRFERVKQHSVLSSHNDEDDSYHIGIRRDIYDRSRFTAHYHRSKARPHASTFSEDWPHYREKESPLRYYDKRIAEHKTKCLREFHRRDNWGSGDEIDLCSHRGWDGHAFFSETRVKRTKHEIVESEQYLRERECIIRDREHLFQNQPHFTSKYSVGREQQNLRKDYYDIRSSMRSRRELSLEYGYSDGPALDRYARPYPLNFREAEHLDLEINCERRLRHVGRDVGTFGRGNQYLETPPLDLDCPWYIRDEDKDGNWQASQSTRDYLDGDHAYTERRLGSTLCRDDVDDLELFEKSYRHGRYISHRNFPDDRQHYNHDDTHDRQDTVKNLDKYDYFVRKQNDFHSKGMSWMEDKRSNRCSDNDLCDKDELGSFENVSRHKWYATRSGFDPGGMSMQTEIKKHKQHIVRVGGSNFCDTSSKMATRVEHKKIGLWCRNAVELRHVRERKTVQPSGKCSKSRRDSDNDVRATAEERVLKNQEKQRQIHELGTFKAKEIRAVNIDASDDLEEGQIPTAEPCKEILKENNGGLKRMSHNQKVTNQNELNAYDENWILETMAKMEKRRERFKDYILPKKETDSDPKLQVDPVIQTADESKQQRPVRKRRWGGS